MKRLYLTGLIFCSTLILSGCSYYAEFVIVNNSDDFIEIIYEAKKPNYKSLTPLYVTLEEFNNSEKKWRIIPQDRHKIDKEKGVVEVKLFPNETLRMESVNAGRIKTNPYEELNTKSLKIIGKNGSINLEGNQVFDQFTPKSSRWVLFGPETGTYMIDYK